MSAASTAPPRSSSTASRRRSPGPADGTIGLISFTGLNLTGASHSLQFTYECAGCWVFVSEVTFQTATVPEPATWALMIGGFVAVGAAVRRRRAVAA